MNRDEIIEAAGVAAARAALPDRPADERLADAVLSIAWSNLAGVFEQGHELLNDELLGDAHWLSGQGRR